MLSLEDMANNYFQHFAINARMLSKQTKLGSCYKGAVAFGLALRAESD